MRRGMALAVLIVLALGWFRMGEAARGTGFVVSPAFQEVRVPADKAEVPYALQITNRNAADQNFRLSVVDFGALDEEGGVAFLGTPSSELEHKYGLASWVRLEKDALFVPAGKSVKLDITIMNRASLAPGGHYGAVLATAVTDTGQAVENSVGVKQVVSSLVLAVKDGGADPKLKLVGQTSDAAFWHLPSRVEQRYQNLGNVHVAPRGVVAVQDPAGRVVARVAINEGSGAILPESFRRYKATLMPVAAAWMPGRYRIVSTYRYDGTDKTLVYTTMFWYVGAVVVWLVGLLALAAAGLLGWWLWRRRR
ncbi:MAG: era [Patescibacteria group bacterium]|nr:era [Patescibacteria group bacterium]